MRHTVIFLIILLILSIGVTRVTSDLLSHSSNSKIFPTVLYPSLNQTTDMPGSWECWGNGIADPCRHELNSIYMVSSNNGWAVGAGGVILNWDGDVWSMTSSPTTEILESVTMVSSNDGWAVGRGGVILRWNGVTWNMFASPTTETLNSVTMVSENNGWAVGNDGVILRWNGNVWATFDSPTTHWLNSVTMVSGDDGWIVGGSGVILRWDGSVWTLFSSPTINQLRSVTMVSLNNGWAVGEQGTILHWNGIIWDIAASPITQGLSSVVMVSADDGWAVGGNYGVILRWNGTEWELFSGLTGENLAAIAMVSTNNGWAVGREGNILHWDGTTWVSISGSLTGQLKFVAMLSSSDGWAVGTFGNILRWNGATWNGVASPTGNSLDSIAMVSTDNGWAVGRSGTILHWDGVTWATVSTPTNRWLFSVDMISASDGWAVGEHGVILRWDGTAWNIFTSPTDETLYSLHMVSGSDGWAVGDNGIILRWNGIAWTMVTSPVTNRLNSVTMVSSSDGWAVGLGGVILYWNGFTWNTVTSPTTGGIASVSMISSDNGWAVGVDILHWNGFNWVLVTNPRETVRNLTPDVLTSVFMTSENDGWIVGQNGWNGFFLRFFVPPIIITPSWTVLVYLACDADASLDMACQQAMTRLQQAAANPHINILALYDKPGANNGVRYHIQPNGSYTDGVNRWHLGEINTAHPDTLASFITWGRQNYPAEQTALVILGHGLGHVGIGWDLTTGSQAYLTPTELRAAIYQGTAFGAEPFDLVFYDACLMGLLEHAYQLDGLAQVMVAAENLAWLPFPYQQLNNLVDATTTPRQLASGMVAAYAAAYSHRPYTISALDLTYLGPVVTTTDTLAQALQANMLTQQTAVQNSRTAAQKFNTHDFNTISNTDAYLDLYDLAHRLQSFVPEPTIQAAAADVKESIGQAGGDFIIAEAHASGFYTGNDGNQYYWDLDNAQGVAIYFPHTSGGPGFDGYMTHQFQFTIDTHWNNFLTEYYGVLGPPPEPGGDPELPPVLVSDYRLFLPAVVR